MHMIENKSLWKEEMSYGGGTWYMDTNIMMVWTFHALKKKAGDHAFSIFPFRSRTLNQLITFKKQLKTHLYLL